MTKIKQIFLSSLFIFISCENKNKELKYFEPTNKTINLVNDFKKYYTFYFTNDKPKNCNFYFELFKENKGLFSLKLSHVKKSAITDLSNIKGYSIINNETAYLFGDIDEIYFRSTKIKQKFNGLFVYEKASESEYYDPPYLKIKYNESQEIIKIFPEDFTQN